MALASDHDVPDDVWDEIYQEEAPLAPRPRRSASPARGMQLVAGGFMAFVKGAIGSAFIIAPFFGLWAALATTLAFTGFCLWLAARRLSGDVPMKTDGVAQKPAPEKQITIVQAGTCYPKVRR